MRKYQLYDTASDWNTQHDLVMAHVGIPVDGTTEYAEIEEITNPDSSDLGKFIFPVLFQGPWQCDSLFDESDLQDWQEDWYPNPPG